MRGEGGGQEARASRPPALLRAWRGRRAAGCPAGRVWAHCATALLSLSMLVLSLLVVPGCRRGEARHTVLHVEAVGAEGADAALLGMSSAEVASLLRQALRAEGHFQLPVAGEAGDDAGGAVALRAQLAFAREADARAADAPAAVEVGLTLEVRAGQGSAERPEEVDVLVQEPVRSAPADAARRALLVALRDVCRRAHLHLRAHALSDRALVEELAGAEPAGREAAVHALVERRRPEALPALLSDLQTPEPLALRRAIDLLAQLRDVRAVPPLIERAAGESADLQSEVVTALGAIGGEEAEAYLFTVARGHDAESVRSAAERALERLAAHRGRSETGGPGTAGPGVVGRRRR